MMVEVKTMGAAMAAVNIMAGEESQGAGKITGGNPAGDTHPGWALLAVAEIQGAEIIAAAIPAENHDPVVTVLPAVDTVAANSSSSGGCRPSLHRTEALKGASVLSFHSRGSDGYFFAGAGDEVSLAAG